MTICVAVPGERLALYPTMNATGRAGSRRYGRPILSGGVPPCPRAPSADSPIPVPRRRIPCSRLQSPRQNGIEHHRRGRVPGVQISVQAHLDRQLAVRNAPVRRWRRKIRRQIVGSAAAKYVLQLMQKSGPRPTRSAPDRPGLSVGCSPAAFIATRVGVKLLSNLTPRLHARPGGLPRRHRGPVNWSHRTPEISRVIVSLLTPGSDHRRLTGTKMSQGARIAANGMPRNL